MSTWTVSTRPQEGLLLCIVGSVRTRDLVRWVLLSVHETPPGVFIFVYLTSFSRTFALFRSQVPRLSPSLFFNGKERIERKVDEVKLNKESNMGVKRQYLCFGYKLDLYQLYM